VAHGADVKQYELFVGGSWVGGSGEQIASVNPYTEEVWAHVPEASPADVDEAVAAAAAAFDGGWRLSSGVARAELLSRLADALERDADRLARIETTDTGKLLRETRHQVRFAARIYRFFAGCADKLEGATKPLDDHEAFDFTTVEPLGVAALVTSWNSPLQLLANKLAPALAAGNTAVVKPSEHASASTLEFARLVEEVGFPPGVVNVVAGGPSTGEALVGHPDVNKVSFTGSVGTGVRVAQLAAQSIVPVTLELGGKSANIVFPDANLERAIPGVVAGIYAAAGQTCVAGSRLLVHRSIHDEVVQALADRARALVLGDPLDDRTQMGPIAHRAQLDKTLDHIAWAHADGAELVAGGTRPGGDGPGLFVAPTLFVGVSNDTRLAQEEVFGPVLAVLSFGDEDEAIAIANATRFGLAAGVWTESLSRAHRVGRRLRCGTVWVNTYRRSATQAPFGGVKQSGYGRERGTEALRDYTTVKNTMIDLSENRRDEFTLTT
jgi:acyl-CoA reductase-like NAD-dependent aldehyde dehydrogenase